MAETSSLLLDSNESVLACNMEVHGNLEAGSAEIRCGGPDTQISELILQVSLYISPEID